MTARFILLFGKDVVKQKIHVYTQKQPQIYWKSATYIWQWGHTLPNYGMAHTGNREKYKWKKKTTLFFFLCVCEEMRRKIKVTVELGSHTPGLCSVDRQLKTNRPELLPFLRDSVGESGENLSFSNEKSDGAAAAAVILCDC